MKRALPLLLPVAALLVVCGPQSSTPSQVPLQMYLSGAFTPRLASFQVSIVSNAADIDRDALEKTCVVDKVDSKRFVLQEDASGQKKKAVVFPSTLGTSGQQDLHVGGIEAGKNYLFVIEALSKDSPPQLLASGNALIQDFRAEENSPQTVVLRGYSLPDGGTSDGGISMPCDPRIER